MSRQSFSRGDRVRVTLEGEITRILDIEPGSEEVELRVENPSGRASYVYTDMATVEKIEPPVEFFEPGSVVRSIAIPELRYVVGQHGYFSFTTKDWHPFTNGDQNDFTTKHYEPVPG